MFQIVYELFIKVEGTRISGGNMFTLEMKMDSYFDSLILSLGVPSLNRPEVTLGRKCYASDDIRKVECKVLSRGLSEPEDGC